MFRSFTLKAVSALVFAATLFAIAAESADAQFQRQPDPRSRATQDQARDGVQSGNLVPMARVIGQVRRSYPGSTVQDAELELGSQPRYVVKLLTRDGRRVDVVVDARTGRILFER